VKVAALAHRLRPRPTDPARERPITAEQFFRLAYGRPPAGAEADLLVRLVGEHVTSASQARAVLLAFDHQKLPTSFDLRLTVDDLELVGLDGFSLWVDRRDVSVSAIVLDRREWEPHIAEALKALLRPGDSFIDVGANIGYHTFLAASLVGSTGAVTAFEPAAENCRLLWLSRHENDAGHVTINALALDRSAGLRYLAAHLGSNGGLVPEETAAIESGLGSFVTAARLDDAYAGPPVRLMKVDVEGAEFAALDGAARILERDRPYLILEFSVEMSTRVSQVKPFEALQALVDDGYDLFVVDKATGQRIAYGSAEALRLAWGDESQIEDLLLMPR